MNETQAILKLVEEAKDTIFALATVTQVRGSAYRRPGARMLIAQDHRTAGSISGGCLEGDVVEHALRVMLSGEACVLTYDTTSPDDIVLGLGLGCNGVVQILVERVDAADGQGMLAFLRACHDQRKAGRIATVLPSTDNPGQPLQRMFQWPDGTLTSTSENVDLLECLEHAGEARAVVFEGARRVFVEHIAPLVPLVIFGGGDDAQPLVRLSKELGWHVTVIDSRAALVTKERFPLADAVCCMRPEAMQSEALRLTPDTLVVVMTHRYLQDQACLRHLLRQKLRYIGVLGPKGRTTRLLKELEEEGCRFAPENLASLHGPAGLDLGGDAPEEVALSILSEMLAVTKGRNGGPLKDRQAGIHESATKPNDCRTGTVILAAGNSSRLGRPKQLLRYRGQSLLRHAATEALAAGLGPVAVVLGSQARQIRSEVDDLPVMVVENDAWSEGMSGSLQAGLVALLSSQPDLKACLFMLCDQPHVSAKVLSQLALTHQQTGRAIVAAEYGDNLGVPALFARGLFAELMALRGQQGARRLIEAHLELACGVPFADGSIDIDTAEDYESLLHAQPPATPTSP